MIDLQTPARQRLLRIAREGGDRHFDPATGLCLIGRDTLWYATGLLFDAEPERRALGRALIGSIAGGDGTHTPATMLAILHGAGHLLEDAERVHLRDAIAADLVRAADVQWRDGNVNHPLGAYATLVLGGELSGALWAVDLGIRRLQEFRAVTGGRRSRGLRQATMSEYNSLTYTALDLVFLALVAEYARDDRARAVALALETAVWTDCALHFHPPTMQFAGPHSRSYQEDSTGGFSSLHAVLAAATGKDIPLDPSLCVRFDHPSSLTQCALTAITPFHITAREERLFFEKPFPVSLRMTTYCEQYHENAAGGEYPFDHEVYPGGWRDLTTVMTEEWALGTASLPYVNGGQTDGLMLRIRRSSPVTGPADFRSLYMRGVYNDAVVGQENRCHVTGGRVDASYLYEEARYGIHQHGGTAIVFAGPKRAGHRGFSSFRLDLIAGGAVPFDDLRLDGRPAGTLPLSAGPSTRIAFRDGRTCVAVIPLTLDPCPASPIRIWTANGHVMISLYNRDGGVTDRTREEMTGWRNGCILHVAAPGDVPSIDAFCDMIAGIVVEDTMGPDRIRRVAAAVPGGTMEAVYDPVREALLSRTWNGEDDGVSHLEIAAGPGRHPLIEPPDLFGMRVEEA